MISQLSTILQLHTSPPYLASLRWYHRVHRGRIVTRYVRHVRWRVQHQLVAHQPTDRPLLLQRELLNAVPRSIVAHFLDCAAYSLQHPLCRLGLLLQLLSRPHVVLYQRLKNYLLNCFLALIRR